MKLLKKLSPKVIISLAVILLFLVLGLYAMINHKALWESVSRHLGSSVVSLPAPNYAGKVSLEQSLKERHSVNNYKPEALSIDQLSQLLWAAQGITSSSGDRTAPSAGGLHPLEIYVISGDVKDLPAGVYHYLPESQALELVSPGDKRKEIAAAVQNSKELGNGAVDIIITANPKKTIAKFGSLGQRFVYLEAGHATQNLLLQAVTLGLGSVQIGSFNERQVQQLIGAPKDEEAIYLVPVGKI